MHNLASSYHATRKLKLALALYEETLRLRQVELGADHPDTLEGSGAWPASALLPDSAFFVVLSAER